MARTDWVNGEKVFATHMNSLGVEVNSVLHYNVDVYGADPTGTDFSDEAVAAARTAMGSSRGLLVFGPGVYKLADPITTFAHNQGVVGAGKGITRIMFSGTGDCIRALDARAWSGLQDAIDGVGGPGKGGPFTGFTIDGTGSGVNSSGLHLGDLSQTRVDLEIVNFDNTGGKGLWLHNTVTWTEQSDIDVDVKNCTRHVVFDATSATYRSFMYGNYRLFVHGLADQDGVVLTGFADVTGGELLITGGFDPGAVSNSGTVLTVGTDGADGSRISRCGVSVAVELGAGAGVGPTTIEVGASAAFFLTSNCRLSFTEGGAAAYQDGNAYGKVRAAGIIDVDDNFGRMSELHALRATGLVTGFGGFMSDTGEIFLGGNWYLSQLTAGAHTISINSASADGLYYHNAGSFDLFIKQPSAGNATVTWPGSFVWLDGSAPTLSTVVDAIDHIRVETPDFGTFYARHVNRLVLTPTSTDTVTNKTFNSATNAFVLRDTGLQVVSTADPTKVGKFSSTGITAGQTRTFSFPDFDGTMATRAGTETHTNKTLTDPKINQILDPVGGGTMLSTFGYASAVNYFHIENAAGVNHPTLYALGGATDLDIPTVPKGAGRLKESGNIVGSWIAVPATATSTGKVGQMAADTSWLYICTATDTWRRVAIASW